MSQVKLDMNGYRDPRERERERMERLRELERFPVPAAFSRGGGGSSERQCGYRKEGGVYAEVPTSPNGKPLEHFLVCPPVPIDAQEYGLHPKGLGVKIVELPETCETCKGNGETVIPCRDMPETKGYPGNVIQPCSVCGGLGLEPVAHVFDIVGTDAYPNVADYLEEARRLGVSRRLELEGAEYARLTRRSRLILLHKRACLLNTSELIYRMGTLELERMNHADCPKYHPQHKCQRHADGLIAPPPPHSPACAALYWHLIEGGITIPERSGGIPDVREDAGRYVVRELASGSYCGYCPPGEFKPDYALGIFAIFPLVKLTVIDPKGEYPEKVAKASRSGLDVDIQEA